MITMLERIKRNLPTTWWNDNAPILDAALNGMAWCFDNIAAMIGYAELQTRIATTTDAWLDLVAFDFFGNEIRRNGASDDAFRSKIKANLLRERVTRFGMAAALKELTGKEPDIFEPERVADACGIGVNFYLGVTGKCGSMMIPYQCFIDVHRQPYSGISGVAGLSTPPFGLGESNMASLIPALSVSDSIIDDDIFYTIEKTKLAGTIAWVRILT